MDRGDEARRTCHGCTKVYTRKDHLRRHWLQVKNLSEDAHKSNRRTVRDAALSRDRCLQAARKYAEETEPRGSLTVGAVNRVINTTTSVPCPHCGKNFLLKYKLNRHIKQVHQKPYACDQCDLRFNNARIFTKHQQLHRLPVNADNLYQCSVSGCTKAFKSVRNLALHTRLHGSGISDMLQVSQTTPISTGIVHPPTPIQSRHQSNQHQTYGGPFNSANTTNYGVSGSSNMLSLSSGLSVPAYMPGGGVMGNLVLRNGVAMPANNNQRSGVGNSAVQMVPNMMTGIAGSGNSQQSPQMGVNGASVIPNMSQNCTSAIGCSIGSISHMIPQQQSPVVSSPSIVTSNHTTNGDGNMEPAVYACNRCDFVTAEPQRFRNHVCGS